MPLADYCEVERQMGKLGMYTPDQNNQVLMSWCSLPELEKRAFVAKLLMLSPFDNPGDRAVICTEVEEIMNWDETVRSRGFRYNIGVRTFELTAFGIVSPPATRRAYRSW